MPIIPIKKFQDLKTNNPNLKLASPINEHAKAISEFYLTPYGSSVSQRKQITRQIHGVLHFCRATAYIKPLVNFRKKYGDENTKQLTEDEIQIAQLLAAWHDSGRGDEGIDYWDKDSAMNFFHYATTVLNMSKEDAMFYAEVIANKDYSFSSWETPICHKLIQDRGNIKWKTTTNRSDLTEKQKTLIKLLHDADCLDIKRVRVAFEPSYLFVYQDIARNNQNAQDELGLMLYDIFYIISKQHDTIGLRQKDSAAKEQYELDENCYDLVAKDLLELNTQNRPLGTLFIQPEQIEEVNYEILEIPAPVASETSIPITTIDYKEIVDAAEKNHNTSQPRHGFGNPPRDTIRLLSQQEQNLIDLQIHPNPDQDQQVEKANKQAIIKYLDKRKLDLRDSFSFANYLLDGLREKDKKNHGRWQYYINHPIVVYKQQKTLYHGSKVRPETIFTEGLKAEFPHTYEECREDYTGNIDGLTGHSGVSLTPHFSTAEQYGQYIYVIDYNGAKGVDIDATLAARDYGVRGIGEINVAEKIPGEQIVGVYERLSQNYWQFQENPQYQGSLKTEAKTKHKSTYFFHTKAREQVLKLNPSQEQVQEILDKIKQLIQNSAQKSKWTFGTGGSSDHISIDEKKYPVPNGIKQIWDIISSKNYHQISDKLLDIKRAAEMRNKKNLCFFFGQRHPYTVYIYDKIKDLSEGHLSKHYTAQKEAVLT